MTKINIFGNSVVITPHGFTHAFRLKSGDYILGADGCYKKISKVDKGNFEEAIEIKGHGCPNLKLLSDQFVLATNYVTKWNKDSKSNERVFSPLLPVSSPKMKGFFWSSPTNLPIHPTALTPTSSLAWFMGAYFSCGFTMYDGKIYMKTNDFRYEDMEKALKELNLRFGTKKSSGRVEYFIDDRSLGKWAKDNISVGYKLNAVPMEVYGWDKEMRERFFDGLIWGKGMDEGERYKISFSNKTEALAVKVLAQSIDLSVALYVSISGKASERVEKWQMVAEKNARSSEAMDGHRIGLVRSTEKSRGERLYALETEEEIEGLYIDTILVSTKKEG